MHDRPVPGKGAFFSLLALLLALVGPRLGGQELQSGVKDAYFRAVAQHFELPFEEVSIVGEWELEADEVPVVLFIAERAGVPPDALIGVRRGGQPWREVALRFGLRVRSFHVALPAEATLGVLRRAYGEFRGRPAREWDRIELNDLEIVSLVNLRVLSEALEVSPLEVLQSREEAGSFVAGFARILGIPSVG